MVNPTIGVIHKTTPKIHFTIKRNRILERLIRKIVDFTLIDNKASQRYEIKLTKHTAFAEYIRAQDKIYLPHTEVPSELEGQGIGTELVKQVLEDIKEKDLTLVPLCPFVALYIKRHPEWKKLVLKGINIG